jgi:molecular chaperone Hsp33
MSDADNDYLYRFVFEQFGVRGEFVCLGASWQAVRERHDYPAVVEGQLGKALTSVLLLSGTIKFKGSLILQLQGNGMLKSLVAQATDKRTLRGMASFDEALKDGQAVAQEDLLGHARLVLTAESPSGERYQGIVPVDGGDVASAVEGYFVQSEQLPTRLWLAADEQHAAGLFLQRLPQSEGDDEHWERVCMLADTIKPEELRNLDAEEVLRRLFHEEDLRLFEPEPVAFRCACSRERVGNALVSLGEGEVAQMLEEMGAIEVNCEFCNANYRFDTVDAAALFSGTGSEPPEGVQ